MYICRETLGKIKQCLQVWIFFGGQNLYYYHIWGSVSIHPPATKLYSTILGYLLWMVAKSCTVGWVKP